MTSRITVPRRGQLLQKCGWNRAHAEPWEEERAARRLGAQGPAGDRAGTRVWAGEARLEGTAGLACPQPLLCISLVTGNSAPLLVSR